MISRLTYLRGFFQNLLTAPLHVAAVSRISDLLALMTVLFLLPGVTAPGPGRLSGRLPVVGVFPLLSVGFPASQIFQGVFVKAHGLTSRALSLRGFPALMRPASAGHFPNWTEK